MWCGECTIGEQKFKRLLVQNELLHNRKEVKGHKGIGRPKKDDKHVTIAVKVHAVASINSEAVKAAVENSTYYVICTNDTERKWTMKELLSVYKKQSVVERN